MFYAESRASTAARFAVLGPPHIRRMYNIEGIANIL